MASRLMPQYRFDQADVIVSFDADFLGRLDLAASVHARLYQQAANQRNRADQVLSRADRIAPVADRLERRSPPARRAGRTRPRRHAPGGEDRAAGRHDVRGGWSGSRRPSDAALDRHRRSALGRARPRSRRLGQPGRARPGALQLHQPDDWRLRHDRRSGASVVSARRQRRGARRAARRARRAAKSARCSCSASTRSTTSPIRRRWPTTSRSVRARRQHGGAHGRDRRASRTSSAPIITISRAGATPNRSRASSA